jgi:hypothetical protein
MEKVTEETPVKKSKKAKLKKIIVPEKNAGKSALILTDKSQSGVFYKTNSFAKVDEKGFRNFIEKMEKVDKNFENLTESEKSALNDKFKGLELKMQSGL